MAVFYPITITPPTKTVEASLPSLSYANSVWHPTIFQVQRHDITGNEIISQADNGAGKLRIIFDVSGGQIATGETFTVGDNVYLFNDGYYDGNYEILAYTYDNMAETIELDLDVAYNAGAPDDGYMNFIDQRLNYYLEADIRIPPTLSPASTFVTIITGDYPRYTPDATGLAKCDISAYLQSLVGHDLNFNHDQKNINEEELGLRYSVHFRAKFTTNMAQGFEFQASSTMWTSNGVKKVGDLYGQNMGEYMMFYPDYASPVIDHPRGKFLNKFEKPKYFDGYPFALYFYYIYTGFRVALRESIDDGDTLRTITRLLSSTYYGYVNAVKLDESYASTDRTSSAQLIIFQSSSTPISAANNGGNLEITFDQQNTLNVGDLIHVYIPSVSIDESYEILSTSTDGFADTTTVELNVAYQAISNFANAKVLWNDQTMSEELEIEIDDTCYDNPIYLRFLNSAGGYSYWLFHTMQEYNDDIGDEITFEPYVEDLETAQENIVTMSKSVIESIDIGAEHLSIQQATALRDLMRSVHVQMYNGVDENDLPKWLTVRPQTGTYTIYKTNETKANISLTIEMPKITNQQN